MIAICTKIHFIIVNLEKTKLDKTLLTAERRLKLGRARPIAAHNVLADAEAISIVIQYYYLKGKLNIQYKFKPP